MSKLIVGLGNPGDKYENTRHNVGFKVAVALAQKYRIRLNTKACSSLIGKGVISSQEVSIVLPQTYMNDSGQAVKSISAKKEVEPKDILVICDDVNLPLGTLRIRPSGSSGGHKGLASIIELLDSCDFARLRIGIDRDAPGRELSSYVLAPFKKIETKVLDGVIKDSVECCEEWVREGPARAANRFNSQNRKD